MASIITPNMSLTVPGVGTEAGPQYATEINQDLNLLDAHDHTAGRGIAIVPAAMNINTALTFANNFATNVAGVNLQPQSSTPAINTVYESGVDLFYVDGNGNNVQLTSGGGVAGSPGNITGLTPPASVSYISASSTFVFQSDTNIAANLDVGSVLLRNLTPNSTFALTLSAPAALTNNYNVRLPILPASQSFMTIDNLGNIGAPALYPLTSADIASATILSSNIAAATILGSNIANATITSANLAPGAVTSAQLGAAPTIASSAITAYSNFMTSETSIVSLALSAGAVAGRMLFISFANPTTNEGQIGVTVSGSGTPTDAVYRICTVRSGGALNTVNTQSVSNNMLNSFNGLLIGNVLIPSSSLNTMYIIQSADIVSGALTVQVFGRVTVQSVGGGTATFCVMNNTVMTLTVI